MPDPLSDAPAERPPRLSATVVLLRDAEAGLEVLLLQRVERGDHNSGAWVFPGGLVEPADGSAEVAACGRGLHDAAASARLGLPHGGLALYVAALRECFEECGLLLAVGADGAPLALAGERGERVHAWRRLLHGGERTLAGLCRAEGATLAFDGLAYLSHWLTPVGMAKRFDTRFFVALAPPGQAASSDTVETVAERWWRPADALSQRQTLKLLTPTVKTLEALAGFASAAEAMAWAREPREVPRVLPRLGTGAGGRRPVLPDEPAWAELGRIDPDGSGRAACDITPGVPVRLSARVLRVTAGNGSAMTGPGTNSYLVTADDGSGTVEGCAVIDPGPLDDRHVQALLAAAPGPIRWIFATHTHPDHSPATVALKAATGATVHGRRPDHPKGQDASFAPDVVLRGGERIPLGPRGPTLQAIHTPGHASNHLCFLLEEERTLFTGDQVMQSSTVVINPPDGDMAAYLGSLRALGRRDDIEWLAPGHGFLIAEPKRAFDAIVAHRLRREAKVLDALVALGPASAQTLLGRVYADVPEHLHPAALRSLEAHLIKLEGESRARRDGLFWSA